MKGMKKRIAIVMMALCMIVSLTACGSKSAAPATLSPEEELLNSYNSVCSDLSYEQNYLAELISQAEDKLKNTRAIDVADEAVLETLSDALLEAMDYKNYSIKTFELGDNKIQSEMTEVEEAYEAVSKIANNLEGAISVVEESIQEQIRIEEEKKAALIWPGKTYTWESKDANGYVVEVKMKFGSWIKASDRENLNKAWQKAGGEGEAPDVSTFSLNNYTFKDNSAVMTFATLEYTNKTEGYDFSEQYPYECNATYCTRLNLPIESKLRGWQGKIYFSNGPSDMNRFDLSYSTVSMKENHWGPATIAFAVENVFTPNFDENGNPALDEVTFSFGRDPIKLSFGSDPIKLPSIWKTTEPISVAESDYFTPRNYDEVRWELVKGGITDNGWVKNSDMQDATASLVLGRYRIDLGYFNKGGNSEMSINLRQLYSDFQGDITIAAESKDNQGTLRIQIYGDGLLLWESEDITGQSTDVHFNVDVTDVRKLEIKSVTDENNPGPSVAIINDIIS